MADLVVHHQGMDDQSRRIFQTLVAVGQVPAVPSTQEAHNRRAWVSLV